MPLCKEGSSFWLTSRARRSFAKRSSNAVLAVQEAFTFAACYLTVRSGERRKPYNTLTSVGRFNHYLVDPLFHWFGENERVMATPSTAQVGISRKDRSIQTVVNAASHNYVGTYALAPEDEFLQCKCLDQLPFANADAVPLLNTLIVEGLRGSFKADCCFMTSTGY